MTKPFNFDSHKLAAEIRKSFGENDEVQKKKDQELIRDWLSSAPFEQSDEFVQPPMAPRVDDRIVEQQVQETQEQPPQPEEPEGFDTSEIHSPPSSDVDEIKQRWLEQFRDAEIPESPEPEEPEGKPWFREREKGGRWYDGLFDPSIAGFDTSEIHIPPSSDVDEIKQRWLEQLPVSEGELGQAVTWLNIYAGDDPYDIFIYEDRQKEMLKRLRDDMGLSHRHADQAFAYFKAERKRDSFLERAYESLPVINPDYNPRLLGSNPLEGLSDKAIESSMEFMTEDEQKAAGAIQQLRSIYESGDEINMQEVEELQKVISDSGIKAGYIDLTTGMVNVSEKEREAIEKEREEMLSHAENMEGGLDDIFKHLPLDGSDERKQEVIKQLFVEQFGDQYRNLDIDSLEQLNTDNFVLVKYLDERISDVAKRMASKRATDAYRAVRAGEGARMGVSRGERIGRHGREARELNKELKSLRQEWVKANAAYRASSRLLLLNQIPYEVERNIGRTAKSALHGATEAIVGKYSADKLLGPDPMQSSVAMLDVLEQGHLPVDEKLAENLLPTRAEEIAYGLGSVGGFIGRIAIMSYMGQQAGIPQAIAGIGGMYSLGRFAGPTRRLAQLAYADARFQVSGANPGQGATFSLALQAFEKIPLQRKMRLLGDALYNKAANKGVPGARAIQYGTEAFTLGTTANISMTSASQLVDLTESTVNALLTDREFDYELEKRFGKGLDEYQKRLIGEISVNWMYGGRQMFPLMRQNPTRSQMRSRENAYKEAYHDLVITKNTHIADVFSRAFSMSRPGQPARPAVVTQEGASPNNTTLKGRLQTLYRLKNENAQLADQSIWAARAQINKRAEQQAIERFRAFNEIIDKLIKADMRSSPYIERKALQYEDFANSLRASGMQKEAKIAQDMANSASNAVTAARFRSDDRILFKNVRSGLRGKPAYTIFDREDGKINYVRRDRLFSSLGDPVFMQKFRDGKIRVGILNDKASYEDFHRATRRAPGERPGTDPSAQRATANETGVRRVRGAQDLRDPDGHIAINAAMVNAARQQATSVSDGIAAIVANKQRNRVEIANLEGMGQFFVVNGDATAPVSDTNNTLVVPVSDPNARPVPMPARIGSVPSVESFEIPNFSEGLAAQMTHVLYPKQTPEHIIEPELISSLYTDSRVSIDGRNATIIDANNPHQGVTFAYDAEPNRQLTLLPKDFNKVEKREPLDVVTESSVLMEARSPSAESLKQPEKMHDLIVSRNAPLTSTGERLSSIPAHVEVGSKEFDHWLYENTQNIVAGDEHMQAYINQINADKVTKTEREAMMNALFGTSNIGLSNQNRPTHDTERTGRIRGVYPGEREAAPTPLIPERGSEGTDGGRVVEPAAATVDYGTKATYLSRAHQIVSSDGENITIIDPTGQQVTVHQSKLAIAVPDEPVFPEELPLAPQHQDAAEIMEVRAGDLAIEGLSDRGLNNAVFNAARLANLELTHDEALGLSMFVRQIAREDQNRDKPFAEVLNDAIALFDMGKRQGMGRTPLSAPVNLQAKGSSITTPHGSYNEAVNMSHEATGQNLWVRHEAGDDNSDRTLLVQFSSHLLYGDQPLERDKNTQFFDNLYRLVPGYDRTVDFWEVPLWISRIAGIEPNTDVYVIRNMDEATNFIKEAGYNRVNFSALDVNAKHIESIVKKTPQQKYAIGGYTDFKPLEKLKNVKLYESVEDYSKQYGLDFSHDYNYQHFSGTKVIPRIKLSDGCKYKCAFCTVPKKVKSLSAEEVFRQIDAIKNLDARLVYLDDKTFGQADNYTMLPELYQRIKEYNPDFEGFIVQTTPLDFASDKKFPVDFVRDAHIRYVELGIETYNDDILTKLNKGHSHSKYVDKSMDKARATGVNIIPNLIVGLSGGKGKGFWTETPQTYKNTLGFLNSNRDVISHINAYSLALYEGTDLANTVEARLESDKNENIIEKSWHKNPKVHKKAMDDFSDFALRQLENRESAVGFEMPVAMSSDKKPLPKDKVTQAVRKDLGSDVQGNVSIYHYSDKDGITEIDPSKFGKNTFTGQDRRVGGASFYYAKRGSREPILGPKAYVVKVPAERLYPLAEDPSNYIPKITKAMEDYSKKNLGGAKIPVNMETLSEFSRLVLEPEGYYGVYSPFQFKSGRQISRNPRVDVWREMPVDEKSTNNLRRFGAPSPSPVDALRQIRIEITNDIQEKKTTHPDNQKITARYYDLENNINEIVKDPLLRPLIDENLLKDFDKWKNIFEFTDPEDSPLRQRQWAVLTAENPQNKTLPEKQNKERNEKLEKQIKELGFEPVKVLGRYGGPLENSFLIWDMPDEQAVAIGQEHGQESVLTPVGLIFGDNTVVLSDLNNIDHRPEMSDFFSVYEIDGEPIKFSLPLVGDWEKRLPLRVAQQMTNDTRRGENPNQRHFDLEMKPDAKYQGDQIYEKLKGTLVRDMEGYPQVTHIPQGSSVTKGGDVALYSFGVGPDAVGGERFYINIQNPAINDPDNSVVQFSDLKAKLGDDALERLALAIEHHIIDSEPWQELYPLYNSVQSLLREVPTALEQLSIDTHLLFDNPDAVRIFKDFGFDGAIFGTSGDNDFATEHRVFSEGQIISYDTGEPYTPTPPSAMFSTDKRGVYISPSEQALERVDQEKATPAQWLSMMLKNGAKQKELDWMGWPEFVEGKKSLTKSEVGNWIQSNKVELQDVYKEEESDKRKLIPIPEESVVRVAIEEEGIYRDGVFIIEREGDGDYSAFVYDEYMGKFSHLRDAIESWNDAEDRLNIVDETKYSKYVAPGGENYGELLLTLPQRRLRHKYLSRHWGELNVIASIRKNDRIDKQNQKLLFLEEVQSDWQRETREGKPVPPMPFPKTGDWVRLSLRRMLREAAEQGYDGISWTPGEIQNKRYELSKHIEEIHVIGELSPRNRHGGRRVAIIPKEGEAPSVTVDKKGIVTDDSEHYAGESLDRVIGKEMAEKIMQAPDDRVTTFSDLDLAVGGEGMIDFYDKILVSEANKIGKKYGAKVGYTEIEHIGKAPYMAITPKMRDAIMEGVPMFSADRKPIPDRSLASAIITGQFIKDDWMKKLGLDQIDRITTNDVVRAISEHERSLKTFDLTNSSDENVSNIAEYIAAMTMQRLLVPHDRNNPSPLGWYSFLTSSSLDIASLVFPELENNQTMRDVWTTALAITSQGNDLFKNTDVTALAYSHFKEHNRFPSDPLIQFGTMKTLIAGNFKKFNDLIEKRGLEGAVEFLREYHSVRDLEEMGYNISVWNKDMEVPGTSILGPKIGTEYLSSLFGDENWVTFDTWMTRFVDAFIGQGSSSVSRKTAKNNRDGLRELVRKQADPFTLKTHSGLEIPISKKGLTKTDILRNNEKLKEYAKRVKSAYARSRDIDGLRMSFHPDLKTDIISSAKKVWENNQSGGVVKDAPRKTLQKAFRSASEKLATHGVNASPVDIQAAAWYMIKNAINNFKPLKADEREASYVEAAESFAQVRGIPEAKIEEKKLRGLELQEREIKKRIPELESIDNSILSRISFSADARETDFDSQLAKVHRDIVMVNLMSERPGRVVVARTLDDMVNAMLQNNEIMSVALEAKKQGEAGYFIRGVNSEKTGITYYNLTDIAESGKDPISMFFHEQGIHHGLRILIPESQQRINLLNEVFDYLGESRIKEVFPDPQTYKWYKDTGRKHQMAEEYMGRIGEKMNKEEMLSNDMARIWQWFVDKIRKLIDAITKKKHPVGYKDVQDITKASIRNVVGYGEERAQRVYDAPSDIFRTPKTSVMMGANVKGTPGTGQPKPGTGTGVRFDVEKKRPKDPDSPEVYRKLIDDLQLAVKAQRDVKGKKEKGKQAARREIVEQFIRENRKDLNKINPGRVAPALNKVNKAARTGQSLEAAIAGLKMAVEEGLESTARRKADGFVKKLKKIKTSRKTGGVQKAARMLQEGADYKDAVVMISQMDATEVTEAKDYIERFIEGEQLQIEEGDPIARTLERLGDAELMLLMLDTYGDLRNKRLEDVQAAIDLWDKDIKSLKADFKAQREAEMDRVVRLQKEVADNLGAPGGELPFEKIAEILPPEKRTQSSFVQKYQALGGSIASLTHAIWKGFKQGKPASDYFNSTLYRLYQNVDKGVSRKVQMENDMRKELKEIMIWTFDGEKQARKELERKITIPVERQVKKGDDIVYEPRNIQIPVDNAVHVWLSFQSEANKPYMDNVDYMSERHRITQKTFDSIDQQISEQAKEFGTLLAADFFGKQEYYDAINSVFSRKTGRRVPKLPGYIPVAANSWRNTIPYDISNLGIYKSMVNERRGGAYDIDRNAIMNTTLRYIENVSSFSQLAESVSDFAYTLNSRRVKSTLKAMGTYEKGMRIIDLLNKGYNKERTDGDEVFQFLLRRFVVTKILMNYNLVPKQLTSVVAMLDSDFGNPVAVLNEFMRYVSGKHNKEYMDVAKEIVRNHPDLKYRNIADIQSLTDVSKTRIHPMMWEGQKGGRTMGMLATLAWNPTAAGDRMAIQLGAVPIATHNYKQGLKEAEKLGLKGDQAKSYAATKAQEMVSEFINTTQQSGKMTHRSAVQHGGWRIVTPFMNTVMSYSRKVSRHARDIGRDYQAGYKRLRDEGYDHDSARFRAVFEIPPAKLTSLFLFASALPVMFATVHSLGGNWERMWDEDDDTARKARIQMLFDATLGWTKGLFGVGFLLEYGLNQVLSRHYGRRDDNITPILDDALDVIDAVVHTTKIISKYNDETIKDRPQYEQDLYDALARVGITGTGLTLGTPVTFMHRLYEVSTEEEYEDALRAAARMYGVPKRELERIFDGDPYALADEEVLAYLDDNIMDYLDEMRAQDEEVGRTFNRTRYARKWMAYNAFDIDDKETLRDINIFLSNITNDRKAQLMARRGMKMESVDEFAKLVDKYSAPLGKYSYIGEDGRRRTSNIGGLITKSLNDNIWDTKARMIIDSDRSVDKKQEDLRQILRVGFLSWEQYDKIEEMIENLNE